MNQISLKLINEKLQYYSAPPYITNGNRGIDKVHFLFDKNWDIENIFKFLFIIINDKVVKKIQINNDECNIPDDCLKENGDIYFCVVAENEDETIIKTSSRLKLHIYEGLNKDDIITEYPEIKLYRGCASQVKFDFSNFEFYNGRVELEIKRKTNSKVLFHYVFDSNKEYDILFDSAFTGSLNYSDYLYDLIYIAKSVDHTWEENLERFPLCLPSRIKVLEVVNDG